MMSRTVLEVQRDFALSSGLHSEIIWDSLSADQSNILHEKIKNLIPDCEQHSNAIGNIRQEFFKNVWAQRKYTNKNLLSAIIYVLVTDKTDFSLANYSTKFSCHPVFRTKKCINSTSSTGCCIIFVDETGRVYKNWNDYIKNNVLPNGTMVAPLNGVYTFSDHDDQVKLEYHLTSHRKVLKTTDVVAGVTGVVATIPMAAALVFPITAPVMIGAAAISAATTIYSTTRSAVQLSDRYNHEKSIALNNREARGNWIGIAGGLVGIGAAGATTGLKYAAAVGNEISLASKVAVNSINASSILLSGTGVVNGVYDLVMKIRDDEEVSSMDVLQLASSLVVFTHSINNFHVVSQIETKSGFSIRSAINKYIRNNFTKLSTHTSTSNAVTNARNEGIDIIRIVNDIPYREVLMSLHKTYTYLKLNSNATPLLLLPKLITSTGDINMLYLVEELGMKFVQHIMNPRSVLDILETMAKYLCERAFHFLLRVARVFIEESMNKTEQTLNTFISSESVMYRILMNCFSKYKIFTYEFLEKKTLEILDDIDRYFDSLKPVGNKSDKQMCKLCGGYFYKCDL